MAIPSRFHKGDKVYAPRYLIFLKGLMQDHDTDMSML